MPSGTDRVGRAHEWLTSAKINSAVGNDAEARRELAQAEAFLAGEPARVGIRARAAAGPTSERILKDLSSVGIRGSRVVGEETKAPGSPDYDLEVLLVSGQTVGYSLKVQTNAKGVNFRNPSLQSFVELMTGKGFEESITPAEMKTYERLGKAYSEDGEPSLPVGHWAAPIAARVLREAHQRDPGPFVDRLLTQMRAGTNFILAVVDSQGNFKGLRVKSPRIEALSLRARASPGDLRIGAASDKVSIRFLVGSDVLSHLDLYMGSGSGGYRGKRLRGAFRIDLD